MITSNSHILLIMTSQRFYLPLRRVNKIWRILENKGLH